MANFNTGMTKQQIITALIKGLESMSESEVQSAIATAIATKQDALTTAQIAAANSGITSEKLSADEAALSEQVDTGAKNVLKNGETTRTISGVTFTVGADGSVTLSGTASANITSFAFVVSQPCPTDTATYILSGCPAGGAYNTYKMDILNGSASGSVVVADYGTGAEFLWADITNGAYTARIRIQSGTNCDGLKFHPMICKKTDWDISQAYQPYAQTNPELTASKATMDDVFGLGKVILATQSAPQNLDDYTTPGVYFNGNKTNGQYIYNTPTTNLYRLEVTCLNAVQTVLQTAYALDTDANEMSVYMRAKRTSGWQPWYHFSGTQVTTPVPAPAASLQSISPGDETRGEPEQTDDEPEQEVR